MSTDDEFREFREFSTWITQVGITVGSEKVGRRELHDLFDALVENSARFSEVSPLPGEWDDARLLEEHPSHPLTTRFGRQNAASRLRGIALANSSVIDDEMLAKLHTALFDVSAAVAEDVCVALGTLGRPESREHLESFHALMEGVPGWQSVIFRCEWALRRIIDPDSVDPQRVAVNEDPAVIHVTPLGDEIVQLLFDGDGLRLRNPASKVEVPVSQSEAEIFRRTQAARVEEFFAAAGGLDSGEPASRLGALAPALMRGLPPDMLSTMTDATSVRMANATVRGLFSPEGLLDLSSIAYCCVMYDFVLVDATDLEVPPELVDVIVPVRPYEASGIEPRWKIAAARYGEIARTSALRSEIDDTWTRMLGRKVAVDFLSFDSVTDSPGIRQYTPGGPFGFYDPIGSMSRQRNEDFSRDVSIQTFRYLINEKVAESLGVSYNCTSLRFPIESLALSNRSAYRSAAEELLAAVSPSGGGMLQSPQRTGTLDRIVLPHPLALVLSRARRREEIWEETMRLREQFTAVREAFRVGRESGRLDVDTAENMIRDALSTDIKVHKIDSVIQASSAIAAATPDATGFASVSLKAATVLKPAKLVKHFLQLVTRPELRVIRGFHDDLALVDGRVSDVERLWGKLPDRAWVDAAARLSASSSKMMSQFRQRG